MDVITAPSWNCISLSQVSILSAARTLCKFAVHTASSIRMYILFVYWSSCACARDAAPHIRQWKRKRPTIKQTFTVVPTTNTYARSCVHCHSHSCIRNTKTTTMTMTTDDVDDDGNAIPTDTLKQRRKQQSAEQKQRRHALSLRSMRIIKIEKYKTNFQLNVFSRASETKRVCAPPLMLLADWYSRAKGVLLLCVSVRSRAFTFVFFLIVVIFVYLCNET